MSRSKQSASALIVLALGAASLTACAPTSLVVEGSTVTVASAQPFTSFNDQTTYGNTPANASVAGAVNSGFTYYDDTPALVRDESFGHFEVVSQDPFAVTYTVNSGVMWSDGEPVDSADLLLAWAANSGHVNTEGFNPARYIDAETGLFEPFPDDTVYFDGAAHSGLQYVSALPELGDDGRSITLVYDEYFVDWQLAFDVGLPAHVVAQQAFAVKATEDETAGTIAKRLVIDAITGGETATLATLSQVWNSGFTVGAGGPFVGSGPYSIEKAVPNESVTLTANPLYTGDRQPRYETVVVRTITDPLEAVKALAAGEVDVIAPAPSADVDSALAAVDGIQTVAGESAVFEHLDLQFSGGKNMTFNDPLLREAFLATVPVAEIVELSGGVARDSAIFPPQGDSAPRVPDVAKAKRLIAQSGAVAPEVCILFDPSNPRRLAEFEIVREGAEKAGFVVSDCSASDWEGFLGVPHAYDAALFAWNETTTAVSAPEARLLSTSTVSNFSNYASPTVDGLLAELAVADDAERQQSLLEQIDAQLAEDAYGMPLYQFATVVAHRDSIDGVAPSPLSGLLWNVWQWQPAQSDG